MGLPIMSCCWLTFGFIAEGFLESPSKLINLDMGSEELIDGAGANDGGFAAEKSPKSSSLADGAIVGCCGCCMPPAMFIFPKALVTPEIPTALLVPFIMGLAIPLFIGPLCIIPPPIALPLFPKASNCCCCCIACGAAKDAANGSFAAAAGVGADRSAPKSAKSSAAGAGPAGVA